MKPKDIFFNMISRFYQKSYSYFFKNDEETAFTTYSICSKHDL